MEGPDGRVKEENETIPLDRERELYFDFDRRVSRTLAVWMDDEIRSDTESAVHRELQARILKPNRPRHIEYMADAIIRQLEWQDAARAERDNKRQRAIIKAQRKRDTSNGNVQANDGLVGLPPNERSRGILSDDWDTISSRVAASLYDAQDID